MPSDNTLRAELIIRKGIGEGREIDKLVYSGGGSAFYDQDEYKSEATGTPLDYEPDYAQMGVMKFVTPKMIKLNGTRSEVRFDRPIIEGYITNWAAGSRGYFCNGKLASQGGWCEPGYPGTNPATQSNWGPNIDSIPQVVFDSLGPIRFRDARSDFYQTGLTSNNSIRGSGTMGHFGTYTLGVSYLNQGGVNPVEKLVRLNMNGNVSFSLGK